MPISTTCPSCKAIFRLPEKLAGRKVKCQKCQGLFVVPTGEAGTMEPGMPVPEERQQPAVESSAAMPPPASPEDIPVTARFADEDEAPERSRPRRSERRPRRDENPKGKSALLPIVLVLLGVGLFSCLGVIGFAAIWHLAADEQPPPPPFAPRQAKVFRERRGFKNAPGNLNEFGGRPVNTTPTIELKLGADGSLRVESELTLQDEENPDQKRHKHYAIQMEEGKRYQIDMKVKKTIVINGRKMKQFDAYLYLIDDANKIVGENDDVEPARRDGRMHDQDSQIIFTAPRTAIYKIEATFCDNGDGLETGEFTLTVRRLPD